MSAEAVVNLTDQILAERGGRQAFTFTQLAIAHQLGSALTGPADSTTATTVVRLMELLPPLSNTEDGPAWDLSKLSDRQFSLLEKLSAVCRGQAPPRPIRKPPPKPLTARGCKAAELADLLDRVEAEGRALTDDDLLQARNCLSSMMFPLGTLARLVPPELFVAAAPPHAPLFWG